MTGFELLLSHFRTQAAIAKALGLERMTISNWKKRGIPLQRAVDIERVTKGKLKAKKIVPEKF
jgi:DNA-binding transcriptional regulator YdaS (Cro superfamily)